MLSIRYRGTIIRTSAFKLMFLGVITVSMLMLMRLQGLFLAIPVKNGKQLDTSSGSIFPHARHQIQANFVIFTPMPRSTEILSDQLTRIVQTKSSTYVVPTLERHSTENKINIDQIRKFIQDSNHEQLIKNIEKYPYPLTDKSMVIIIQVHNRADYLAHLLRSLSKTRGIENSLLVVSHDFFDDHINRLVDAIKFCKVLQIFFPYSMQLYPDKFPGTDPGDCPRDLDKQKAIEIGCNNANYPDRYGHFREAKFTMTKHHWWWKANTVFDGLNITKNYNGPVVFLEEDHYVSPDFYHVLGLMYDAKKTDSHCSDGCDIMTLGTYNVPHIYKASGENIVQMIPWKSVLHNMGMAFDRKTWNMIKDCKEVFCKYDDYNWDWTLMKISLNCVKRTFRALVMKTPRVFHIGECGMHHKKNCNPKQATLKVDSIINDNEASLFPSSLQVEQKPLSTTIGNSNGGWGDIRDHELCLQAVLT